MGNKTKQQPTLLTMKFAVYAALMGFATAISLKEDGEHWDGDMTEWEHDHDDHKPDHHHDWDWDKDCPFADIDWENIDWDDMDMDMECPFGLDDMDWENMDWDDMDWDDMDCPFED